MADDLVEKVKAIKQQKMNAADKSYSVSRDFLG